MYHEKKDYIRAVLEGVAMNLEIILQAHRKSSKIDRMILTGGGAKGDIVAQILADVLKTELVRPNYVEESTSIAAAVIAGVGCGVYEDFSAINSFLKFGNPVKPREEVQEVYAREKELFEAAYQALRPLYPKM